MVNKVLKKFIIFVTVFVLIFSNCGYTLQVLAATDGITLFGFNIFGSGNIDYEVYFLDQDGNKQKEKFSNVNEKMTMVIEFNPKADGYLKSGTIKAVSKEEGEANFKFEEVYVNNKIEEESLTINSPADVRLLQSELTIDSSNIENQLSDENVNTFFNENPETIDNNTFSDNGFKENELDAQLEEKQNDNANEVNMSNEVSKEDLENNVLDEEEITENLKEKEEAIDTSEGKDENIDTLEEIEEEVLVDEEIALVEENKENILSLSSVVSATIISDDEIRIENVTEQTKIFVNLSFKSEQYLNVQDLYKEIDLNFVGTYININLEEVSINISDNVNIGWNYTKEIEVSSEYTKVSPFKIGDTEGTIVENTIVVKRDITDEKYLPLKETKITLNVPNLSGEEVIDLDVSALKLKATNGEDVNEVSFNRDNWEYDLNNHILTIKVENTENKYTYGEDIYVVTYRYNKYIEEKEISLETEGTVEVTELSGKDNNVIVGKLERKEKVITNIGELITYSIGTTEEKIGKGKINANYNQAEERYESEFDTTVSVNILTNDVLNELTIRDTKEFYINKDGLEFETNDIKYKKIKFRYNEIKEFLEENGTIEINSNNGELLYTLNKELIKSEEDTEISIQGDVRGLEISFKNISVNGNINIEFIKAIGKSSFDKVAFSNFTKLESRINAIVKYSEDSDGTSLPEIKTEKELEESKTEAEITMNKIYLSTTEINENVEITIELNNYKENSDLYVNPIFEIALPKYVKNIDLKSVNILYESGLSIGNSTIYRAEDGTLRMRIEVNGTQTEFSEGEIANGTNIIVNANIELDKYTPRKDDQVKLYYINSGVTNYASQTKWTLGVNVPDGLIKTTNGFDSYVFKLNAPIGFMAINEIQNYDGQNSLVTSIRQGVETREVEMGKDVQVARMNLIAINNTENQCTDVTFLGRIPVKGATDVKTGETLETNIDVKMLSRITENDDNPISAKIYYSANIDANKNLNDSSNGWTEDLERLDEIKSFLIVPDSTVEPGYIFKYTYEFIIPENLPYEAKIYGSFGAFYNNHSDVAITYEATSADLVGLVTQAGPKVEASLSVDIGDGANILSGKRMKYTIAVVNSGSIEANDITVTAPIPEYTLYTEKNQSAKYGDYGFSTKPEKEDVLFKIDSLKPGEVREFSYYVTANQKPSLEYYASGKDENGYYIQEITGYKDVTVKLDELELEDGEGLDESEEVEISDEEITIQEPIYEKKYITEVPSIYISNKAKINVPLLATEIETNEIKNELIATNFTSSINVEYERTLIAGQISDFKLTLKNISGKTLNNVKAIFNVGKIYQYDSSTIDNIEANATFNEEEGKIYFDLGTMESSKIKTINVKVIAKKITSEAENFDCYFELLADGIETEYSTAIPQLINKAILKAEDISTFIPNQIGENQLVIVSTQITNVGGINCLDGVFECVASDTVTIQDIICDENIHLSTGIGDNKVSDKLPIIRPNESITVDIILKTNNLNGSESSKVTLNRTIVNKDQDNINLGQIDFTLLNTEKTEEELENERIEKEKSEFEKEQAEKQKENNNKNLNNNSGTSNLKNNNAQNNINNNSTDNSNLDNNINENNNNNSNENSNNNSNNKNNNDNQNNSQENIENIEEEQDKATYSISGIAWRDANRNGIREDEESNLNGIKVYLLKTNNTMIKSTIIGRDGKYTFNSVENGKYIVAFSFDTEKYNITTYKKSDVGQDRNSDVILSNSSEISAVTNEITVNNGNVENIDIGLQYKDTFDLEVGKYIKSIKVTTKRETKTYDYNNEDLAKIEIPAKYLNGAKIELEYAIIVKNTGSIVGYAEQIVDYLNSDLEFDENINGAWYKGTDGYVYAKNINGLILNPGESTELKLVLNKTMTEDNTGMLSNKVAILSTYNQSGITENDNNNSSVQSTLISVSTGSLTKGIVNILFILILLVIITYILYYKRNGKPPFKIRLKRVYR